MPGFSYDLWVDAYKDLFSLREQLKETMESESNGWRGLLSLPSGPSPRAAKGLKEAEEFRQRVKVS